MARHKCGVGRRETGLNAREGPGPAALRQSAPQDLALGRSFPPCVLRSPAPALWTVRRGWGWGWGSLPQPPALLSPEFPPAGLRCLTQPEPPGASPCALPKAISVVKGAPASAHTTLQPGGEAGLGLAPTDAPEPGECMVLLRILGLSLEGG